MADIFSIKVLIVLFFFILIAILFNLENILLHNKLKQKYYPNKSLFNYYFTTFLIFDSDVFKMTFGLKPIEKGWKLIIWLSRINFILLIIFIIVCLSFGLN